MPFLAPVIAGIGSAAAGAAGAIGTGLAAIGGGSALAGAGGLVSGLAGAFGGSQGNQQTAGQQQQLAVMRDFAGLVDKGPGAQDVSASYGAQTDLAAELDRLRREGTDPTTQDIANQNSLAGRLFRQRQVGLEQDFLRQQQGFEQTAARMGRSPLDPVFRNKLAEQQLQAQERLGAEQNTFATQQAMQQPFQRLQLQQGRADILKGLATQALSNRQALATLGQQASLIRPQGEGGGLGGAIQGFINNVGAGAGAVRSIQGLGSGGAAPAAPVAPPPQQSFNLGVDTSFSGFKIPNLYGDQ